MKNLTLMVALMAATLISASANAEEPKKCQANPGFADTVAMLNDANSGACQDKAKVKLSLTGMLCSEAEADQIIAANCAAASSQPAAAPTATAAAPATQPDATPAAPQTNTECQQAAEALSRHGGEETFGRLAAFIDGLIKNDIAGPKANIDQNPDGDGMMAFATLEPALSGTLAELEKEKKISHDEATKALDKVKACFTSVGKKVVIKTPGGNTVQGEVTSVSSESIEVSTKGAIANASGLPLTANVSILSGFNLVADSAAKNGTFSGIKAEMGYEIHIGSLVFFTPFITGGFGYVSGDRPDRVEDTPGDKRVVGILGGGLKGGLGLGRFAPYLVAEGYGLPGPGFSAGLGTTLRLSDGVSLDASARWMYIPNTNVPPGLSLTRDMGSVAVNGLAFSVGVNF